MLIIFILWYFFHLFCSGWLDDWHHAKSGISNSDYQAFVDDYEAKASKGKNKLEIWTSKTLPGGREQHRWCREHAADPAVYDRLLRVLRLAELPALIFGIWFLLAFCSHAKLPGWLYIAVIIYDLILLLLGIHWRRSIKG
jgi:uncharacterized membrane protein